MLVETLFTFEKKSAAMTATPATPFAMPANRWAATHASALAPEQLLLYRSHLLGSDLTVTNFGEATLRRSCPDATRSPAQR